MIVLGFGVRTVYNPFTGKLDYVRTGNYSGENLTADAFVQDDYYIAPCATNDLIDGSALCIWANATTPLDIPYVNFQPGGPGQASYIAGSFMLVNRNQTILLNVNRTSCVKQANISGVELKIDCNSTSPTNPLGTGPDFLLFGDSQITGELYLRNIDGQWRFFTRELTLRDELYEDILFNDANLTIIGNKFVITDRLNETLVVNINRSETIFATINDSITLNLGTNISPVVNHISYQNQNNPVITIDSSDPTVKHAEVAIIYVGEDTNVTYLFDNKISHNEQFIDQVYDTFGDSGAIYLDGLTPSVSATQINITNGTVRIRVSKHIYTNNVSSGSFFYINSTGNFNQCIDFTCLDKYSSGETISDNKYYGIVWLVVPVKDTPTEQWFLAIPQNKPGTEHVRAIDAEEDVLKTVFFSSLTDFKRTEVPVIRTIHRRTGNNDIVAFPTNDELFQDLRGQIRAGGGSVAPPPITNHDDLNNLVWNVAGHTNVNASDINQDLPTDCLAGTAMFGFGNNMSTIFCREIVNASFDDNSKVNKSGDTMTGPLYAPRGNFTQGNFTNIRVDGTSSFGDDMFLAFGKKFYIGSNDVSLDSVGPDDGRLHAKDELYLSTQYFYLLLDGTTLEANPTDATVPIDLEGFRRIRANESLRLVGKKDGATVYIRLYYDGRFDSSTGLINLTYEPLITIFKANITGGTAFFDEFRGTTFNGTSATLQTLDVLGTTTSALGFIKDTQDGGDVSLTIWNTEEIGSSSDETVSLKARISDASGLNMGKIVFGMEADYGSPTDTKSFIDFYVTEPTDTDVLALRIGSSKNATFFGDLYAPTGNFSGVNVNTLAVDKIGAFGTAVTFTDDLTIEAGEGLSTDNINSVSAGGIDVYDDIRMVSKSISIDDASTTALFVEQNGVKDNTLVVDTTNGRVGINKVPATHPFEVSGVSMFQDSGGTNVFTLTPGSPSIIGVQTGSGGFEFRAGAAGGGIVMKSGVGTFSLDTAGGQDIDATLTFITDSYSGIITYSEFVGNPILDAFIFSDDINLIDNERLYLGTGTFGFPSTIDSEMYHSGADLYINNNVGTFFIDSTEYIDLTADVSVDVNSNLVATKNSTFAKNAYFGQNVTINGSNLDLPHGNITAEDITAGGNIIASVGAVATPSIHFEINPGTGIYYIHPDKIGFAIDGDLALRLDDYGVMTIDGVANAPSYSFLNDEDSGFYRIGTDNVGLALNGIKRVDFAVAGTTVTGNLNVTAGNYSIGNPLTPSAAIDNCNAGTITADDNFIYFCNSTAQWIRSALTSW